MLPVPGECGGTWPGAGWGGRNPVGLRRGEPTGHFPPCFQAVGIRGPCYPGGKDAERFLSHGSFPVPSPPRRGTLGGVGTGAAVQGRTRCLLPEARAPTDAEPT